MLELLIGDLEVEFVVRLVVIVCDFFFRFLKNFEGK